MKEFHLDNHKRRGIILNIIKHSKVTVLIIIATLEWDSCHNTVTFCNVTSKKFCKTDSAAKNALRFLPYMTYGKSES